MVEGFAGDLARKERGGVTDKTTGRTPLPGPATHTLGPCRERPIGSLTWLPFGTPERILSVYLMCF